MRRIGFAAALMAVLGCTAAARADWSSLDALLVATLDGSMIDRQQFFFPDSADYNAATEGLGFAYAWIEGSAGSTSLSVGYYRKTAQGFVYLGPVGDLYGQNPREAAFFPDRIEITTTTLRDGDGRCCPTGVTRWRIARETLAATGMPLN